MTAPKLLFTTLLAVFLLLPATMADAQRTQRRRLSLEVGAQKTLSSKDVANFSVGNEEVAKIVAIPGTTNFIVKGLTVGRTTLLLIYRDKRQVLYEIEVKKPSEGAEVSVPDRENIRLDLYFVEVTKKLNLNLGVGTPGTLGGSFMTANGGFGIVPSSPFNLSASITGHPLPQLDILHATGWGRFLRHAVVVTTNNTEAEIDSGGDIFFSVPASQGNGTDFRTVKFGSRVTITPNYDKTTGRIQIDVESEIADVFSGSAGDQPSRNVTTTRSTANLELGQAIAVGGVEARTESRNRSGLPGLSQIPILGMLFGSHSYDETEKENIIVVVPSVVEKAPAMTEGLVDEVLQVYDDYRGDLDEDNVIGILDKLNTEK